MGWPAEQDRGYELTEIKLAIAGVGNCASSLIQGIEYYRTGDRR